MKLKSLSIVLAMSAALLQACGSDNTTTSHEQGINVKVKEVLLTNVPKRYQYTGTVSAVKQSTLSTRLMGQVEQMLVHEGDKVAKGQLLVAIRSNDLLAKQKQVEANISEVSVAFVNAKKDLDRMSSLYQSHSATQKELDDITTHYQMMQSKLEAVKKAAIEVNEMLNYANITAPYAGTITERFADAGDMANPGMPLLAIEAPSLFEVNAKVPESEIHLLEKGDTVNVTLRAEDKKLKGVVSGVNTSSRFSGAQYDIRIQLLTDMSSDESIKSGMYAQVNLTKGDEQKILVPQNNIINRGQLSGIWTVNHSGSALLRWVRLGKSYANNIEVLSGLESGDKIILHSEDKLYDGANIQIN